MRRVTVVVVLSVLSLAVGVGPAGAEAIVPAEGAWKGETSAGLPVYFGVSGGRVVNTRFQFRWGFCGTFTSHDKRADLEVDPLGHWVYQDPRGQTFEGTFVAPDRAEGKVISVGRELPGCPRTEATFTATPAPPPAARQFPAVICKKRQSLREDEAVTGAYRYRPHSCFLHAYHVARTGSPLYVHLHWLHWGALAATGRGEIPEQVIDARTGKIVRTIYSPVKIRLEGPRSVCGHLIFTEHTVDFLEHEFTAHGESDRLPEPGRGCRPGARSAGLSPAAR